MAVELGREEQSTERLVLISGRRQPHRTIVLTRATRGRRQRVLSLIESGGSGVRGCLVKLSLSWLVQSAEKPCPLGEKFVLGRVRAVAIVAVYHYRLLLRLAVMFKTGTVFSEMSDYLKQQAVNRQDEQSDSPEVDSASGDIPISVLGRVV